MYKTKHKIKKTISGLALAVICASVMVLPVSAGLNIREGALNDDAYGIVEGYKQGWITRSDLEDMLASGGFTGDAADQVKAAIADQETEQDEQENAPNASQATRVEKEEETSNQSEMASENMHDQSEGLKEHEHTYTMVLTAEPNCEEPGLKTFTCDVCGDTYTAEIPAIGHIEDEPIIEREPDCTQSGVKSYYCVLCGKDLRQEEIQATGHISGDRTIVKVPTLFRQGREEVRCTKCDALLVTSVIAIPVHYLLIDIIAGLAIVALVAVFIIKSIRKRRRHHEKK